MISGQRAKRTHYMSFFLIIIEVICGKIHYNALFWRLKKRRKKINLMREEINDGFFFSLVQNKMEEDDLLLPWFHRE